MRLHRAVVAVLGMSCAPLVFTASAGPLTPPAGPVASTLKPLAEIEPRVAINAANTPGDNDATPSTYKIVEPGSYYLVENLQGEFGKVGIEIDVSDGAVTIDLNGFTLDGEAPSGLGLYGILANVSASLTVRNGFVTNWDQDGININSGGGARIEHVTVRGNGYRGIYAAEAIIVNCLAEDNLHGFYLGQGVIRSCVASNNSQNGIFANGSGVIQDCHVERNGLWGISQQAGGTLIIEGSTIAFNTGGAITLCAGARVVDNNIKGLAAEDICIEIRCGNNLIDSNRISDCELGIESDNAGSPGDTITRNVFQDVAAPFIIDIGDDAGPVVTAATAVNPFSNLQK